MENPIIKGVFATVGGIIVAIFVVMLVQELGHAMFPPPASLDPTDPEQLANMMDQIPLGSKIAVVLAWLLGAMAGCAAAKFISPHVAPGWIVAAFMVISAVATTQMFPHPIWMIVCAVVLPIVGKFLGEMLLARFSPS